MKPAAASAATSCAVSPNPDAQNAERGYDSESMSIFQAGGLVCFFHTTCTLDREPTRGYALLVWPGMDVLSQQWYRGFRMYCPGNRPIVCVRDVYEVAASLRLSRCHKNLGCPTLDSIAAHGPRNCCFLQVVPPTHSSRPLPTMRLQPHRQRERCLPRMRGEDMLRKLLTITALLFGVSTLVILITSYMVSCAITRGSMNSLPMSTLNCTSGQLSLGRVYLLPQVSDVEFDYGCYFEHIYFNRLGWLKMAAPRAFIREDGISLRHDSCIGPDIPHMMLPGEFTRPASVMTLRNVCFVRIDIPMCIFPALLLTFPTIAFIRGPYRRHRRRKKGLCLKCGYNLTGNISGICPECGKRK